MKKKIIQMRGLPASGKSTWAKNLVLQDHTYKRINRDDLRAMIDNRDWSQAREKHIIAAEKMLAEYFISQGFNLVVDDTGLSSEQVRIWKEIADKHDYELETKFIDTPIEECIARDITRPYGVGEKVIREMYNRYLAAKVEADKYEAPNGPAALIVDIDGTLAHGTGRNMYDYTRVGEDQPDDVVPEMVRKYYEDDYKIVICSGREDNCRTETEEWLNLHQIPYDHLFMRKTKDNRKDAIIKREIFDEHIRDQYNVAFVLDDRMQVVDMWRSLGLKVLQVAPGDF